MQEREVSRTNCHIFDLVVKEKVINNKVGNFVSLDAPDWVSMCVYHITKKKFILVKEFRHGVNSYVINFPSGTVEYGEEPIEAAKREVTEETGYQCVDVRKLYSGCPNAAFMTNTMTGYAILVDGPQGELNLDEMEDVKVLELSRSEIDMSKNDILQQRLWSIASTINFEDIGEV